MLVTVKELCTSGREDGIFQKGKHPDSVRWVVMQRQRE